MNKSLFYAFALVLSASIIVGCAGGAKDAKAAMETAEGVDSTAVVDSTAKIDSVSTVANDSIPTEQAKNEPKVNPRTAEYDDMLNQYENAANKVESAARLIRKNWEYTESTSKTLSKYGPICDKLDSKLEKCRKEMTPEQWKRFKKIQRKFWESRASISG